MDPEKKKTAESEYVPPDLSELGDAKELTRGNGRDCIDLGGDPKNGCPADL